ncbi:hypothetical protein IC608_04985 [Devosia sp. PTR5]|jgi:hypothetical protein|uniref:Uncharacterized protein n=1 Tax=Devosia oryzisoli TaxID=2774138 RepID=A0A927FTE9_9HYPH|nr:hypothetical protein [Devosia oryzisoli]MBD8064829.1 hypothetical protein [Devosia oryzisoli]
MDRIYDWLLAAGYPREGVDWIRRHRLLVLVALAILAWLPVVLIVWLFLRLLG